MINNYYLRLLLLIIAAFIAGCTPFNRSESIFPHELGSLPIATLLDDEQLQHQAGRLGVRRNPSHVSAIVIHVSGGIALRDYFRRSIDSRWMLHLALDRDGRLYGTESPGQQRFPTAPGVDDVAIHLAIEGSEDEIRNSPERLARAVEVVTLLANHYDIPLNNYDIIDRVGIFTHRQSKIRYGGFLSLTERRAEALLEDLLNAAGGQFYHEPEWRDRFEPGWILVRENPAALRRRPEHDRGRGLTPTPLAELRSVEQTSDGRVIEAKRLRYPHRYPIEPTCVVLHFTATRTLQHAMDILEERRLGAQINIDIDGRAYQAYDTLNERAAAATGTNDDCIQIEIVGRNTAELVANRAQTEKVVELVRELSELYDFPLHNFDIDSLRGVFSHTQAKMRWGRSVWLTGSDFDPGEEYMRIVLEKSDGKYYPPAEWKGRSDDDWAILYRDFQP